MAIFPHVANQNGPQKPLEPMPDLKSKEVKNIKDLQGGDYYRADAVLKDRRKGVGHDAKPDKALEKAYENAKAKPSK